MYFPLRKGRCWMQVENRRQIDQYRRRIAFPRFFILLTVLGTGLTNTGCMTAKAAENGKFDSNIEFFVSGGIAGTRQTLHIDSSGNALLHDEKIQTTKRSRISTEKFNLINAAFDRARAVAATNTVKQLGRPCADCLVYEVRAVVHGNQYQIKCNTIDLGHSPYREVILQLSGVMSEIQSEVRH